MSTGEAGTGGARTPVAEDHAGGEPLARVVFLALLAACFLAFFLTQRLKHTPTVVQDIKLTPYFSPVPSGHLKEESISFKLDRAERVTVEVENSDEDVVARLLTDHPVPRYKQFSLRWNGRKGIARADRLIHTSSGRTIFVALTHGPIAPAGEYKVRLTLSRQHRVVHSTRSFTLVGRR